MARQIVKEYNSSYNEIDTVISSIDSTWNNIKTWDKFKFTKHPYNIYYINPLSDSIEEIKGPYKVFDLLGNTLQTERTNASFKASKDLIKYGPIVVYLKTVDNLYMLFVSRNAVTEEYIAPEIVVNRVSQSTISINNTRQTSIYYSYESTPIIANNLIEIKSGVIEVIQPTSVIYLYIVVDNIPVNIITSNNRTKVINNNFLLICPSNFSKIQAAKLTGNPIDTIPNDLDLTITI